MFKMTIQVQKGKQSKKSISDFNEFMIFRADITTPLDNQATFIKEEPPALVESTHVY